MRSPGAILALAFALSLAGAAAWPSTEWAAERKASLIAEEQCRANKLDCETEAKPRRPKTDSCAASVTSKTVTASLSVVSSVADQKTSARDRAHFKEKA